MIIKPKIAAKYIKTAFTRNFVEDIFSKYAMKRLSVTFHLVFKKNLFKRNENIWNSTFYKTVINFNQIYINNYFMNCECFKSQEALKLEYNWRTNDFISIEKKFIKKNGFDLLHSWEQGSIKKTQLNKEFIQYGFFGGIGEINSYKELYGNYGFMVISKLNNILYEKNITCAEAVKIEEELWRRLFYQKNVNYYLEFVSQQRKENKQSEYKSTSISYIAFFTDQTSFFKGNKISCRISDNLSIKKFITCFFNLFKQKAEILKLQEKQTYKKYDKNLKRIYNRISTKRQFLNINKKNCYEDNISIFSEKSRIQNLHLENVVERKLGDSRASDVWLKYQMNKLALNKIEFNEWVLSDRVLRIKDSYKFDFKKYVMMLKAHGSLEIQQLYQQNIEKMRIEFSAFSSKVYNKIDNNLYRKVHEVLFCEGLTLKWRSKIIKHIFAKQYNENQNKCFNVNIFYYKLNKSSILDNVVQYSIKILQNEIENKFKEFEKSIKERYYKQIFDKETYIKKNYKNSHKIKNVTGLLQCGIKHNIIHLLYKEIKETTYSENEIKSSFRHLRNQRDFVKNIVVNVFEKNLNIMKLVAQHFDYLYDFQYKRSILKVINNRDLEQYEALSYKKIMKARSDCQEKLEYSGTYDFCMEHRVNKMILLKNYFECELSKVKALNSNYTSDKEKDFFSAKNLSSSEIKCLTDKIYTELIKKIQFERQRNGIFR